MAPVCWLTDKAWYETIQLEVSTKGAHKRMRKRTRKKVRKG